MHHPRLLNVHLAHHPYPHVRQPFTSVPVTSEDSALAQKALLAACESDQDRRILSIIALHATTDQGQCYAHLLRAYRDSLDNDVALPEGGAQGLTAVAERTVLADAAEGDGGGEGDDVSGDDGGNVEGDGEAKANDEDTGRPGGGEGQAGGGVVIEPEVDIEDEDTSVSAGGGGADQQTDHHIAVSRSRTNDMNRAHADRRPSPLQTHNAHTQYLAL